MPQAHGPAFQSSKLFFLSKSYWLPPSLAFVSSSSTSSGVIIKNLVKTFQTVDGSGAKTALKAVNDLSVSFPSSSITAVLGPNGAGKTTLIKLLTGSLAPDAGGGSVAIDGVDALENGAWCRKNVGVCPQHDVLYDDLSAREHVELFGATRANGGSEGYVDEALKSVDLLSKSGELVRSFSGGQKRRLSVAISLLGDPKGEREREREREWLDPNLLFAFTFYQPPLPPPSPLLPPPGTVIVLDEPTTGMDVLARSHVWAFIRSAKPGRTIVLTTHR